MNTPLFATIFISFARLSESFFFSIGKQKQHTQKMKKRENIKRNKTRNGSNRHELKFYKFTNCILYIVCM